MVRVICISFYPKLAINVERGKNIIEKNGLLAAIYDETINFRPLQ